MADYGAGAYRIHDRALREHRTFDSLHLRWWIIEHATGRVVDECPTLYQARAAVRHYNAHGIELEAETFERSWFGQCEWFALCANTAHGTRSHPILGDVPICERCDAKVAALDAATRQ